jgi:hypothetical protein
LKTINLYLWLLAIPFVAHAQQNNTDSEALQTFDKIIGLENTKLYNGKRYYNIYKSSENNHNFFTSPNFIKGDVTYDGDTFFNVNLKYDAFNDQLIFKPNGDKSFINIELIRDKVLQFKLKKHHFINSKTITNNSDLVSGYLEIIYNTPNLKLYAKRKKTVTERIRQNRLVYLFSNEPSFYLYYAGNLTEIRSSKSFKKIVPIFNKELKTELKDNKKRFAKDDESFYLFITQWLDFKLKTNSTN